MARPSPVKVTHREHLTYSGPHVFSCPAPRPQRERVPGARPSGGLCPGRVPRRSPLSRTRDAVGRECRWRREQLDPVLRPAPGGAGTEDALPAVANLRRRRLSAGDVLLGDCLLYTSDAADDLL